MGLLRRDAGDHDRTSEPGRLAMPRRRGAASGLLLVVLGAWGALIPFIGPAFDLTIGSDRMFDFTAGRFWLSLLPGAVAVLGGLMLMASANRASATLGAQLALAAGVWFVVGPVVSMLWNGGEPQTGQPLGGTGQQVLELLTYFYGLGAAIIAFAGIALGRVTTRSVRDVERLAPDTAAPPPPDPAERTGRFGRDGEQQPATRQSTSS